VKDKADDGRDARADAGPGAKPRSGHLVPPGTVFAEEAPREESPAEAKAWEAGDDVTIIGLRSRPELNGKNAKVLGPASTSDSAGAALRYLVELPASGTTKSTTQLSVKADNLERASPPSPRQGVSDPPEPCRTSRVFNASFEKLRSKADAEGAGADAAARNMARARGRAHPQPFTGRDKDEVLRVPVHFVPAEEGGNGPSAKVVVVDPRGRGADGSSSDEEKMGIAPGRIRPPISSAEPLWKRPRYRCVPAVEEPQAEPRRSLGSPAPSVEVTSPSAVGGVQQPWAGGSASTARSGTSPHIGAERLQHGGSVPPSDAALDGRWTLSVSQAAQKEDQAGNQKRKLEEKKIMMLETMTKQIQTCLTKLQDRTLAEASREKYQDMLQMLKDQMAKISGKG